MNRTARLQGPRVMRFENVSDRWRGRGCQEGVVDNQGQDQATRPQFFAASTGTGPLVWRACHTMRLPARFKCILAEADGDRQGETRDG